MNSIFFDPQQKHLYICMKSITDINDLYPACEITGKNPLRRAQNEDCEIVDLVMQYLTHLIKSKVLGKHWSRPDLGHSLGNRRPRDKVCFYLK